MLSTPQELQRSTGHWYGEGVISKANMASVQIPQDPHVPHTSVSFLPLAHILDKQFVLCIIPSHTQVAYRWQMHIYMLIPRLAISKHTVHFFCHLLE